MKKIIIIGGGTVFHVRNHLALCAPAYGNAARFLYSYGKEYCSQENDYNFELFLTKMANQGNGNLETNQDISCLVDKLILDKEVKMIIFNPALCDYTGAINNLHGKYSDRLKTSQGEQLLSLYPDDKIIAKIRKDRKDIFLVAFKTTCGATEDEQFVAGLSLLKKNSCNLVLANDTKTRVNMVITPEQARYGVSTNREEALKLLFEMSLSRSKGTFTRSTVKDGESISWNSSKIPSNLREVVNFCINNKAYKAFNGATVGHFAVKIDDQNFITSKRKVDFNNLQEVGMVHCQVIDDDTVIAYGAKPSVGGQSQRIIFKDHPNMDAIVHFHCPPKHGMNKLLSVKEQKYNECGSHQCGKNTSAGLVDVGISNIKCVYLDNHGPNIVFNKDTNPKLVIDFIKNTFDLSKSTDGLLNERI